MNKISKLLLIICIAAAGINSCKSAKTIPTPDPTKSQQVDQKFYLMLRISKSNNPDDIRIEDVEKEVFTDQNNPLPLPPGQDSNLAFRCEVLDINGQILATHQTFSEFRSANSESDSIAIVKFIFRIGENAKSARVSRELQNGVWEEIYTTPIEKDITEGDKK